MPACLHALLALVHLVLLTACGSGPSASPSAEGAGGEVVVFAAASLTDAFEALAEDLEAANPDTDVTYNFGPSNGLASQIVEAAPADVFVSANARQMDVVAEAGLVDGEPQTFVENALEIAVEPGNPRGIAGLDDLASPDLAVVLAAEEVPAGDFAREALATAGVDVAPASLEEDVRSVLTRVELGEADAGIVYRSDIVAASDAVEGVEIPEADNVVATYPVAALRDAPNPEAADAFVEYVLSSPGQATLEEFGFAPAAP